MSPQCPHDVLVMSPQCPHGIPVMSPQCPHGIPTMSPRCPHGIPAMSPRRPRGVPPGAVPEWCVAAAGRCGWRRCCRTERRTPTTPAWRCAPPPICTSPAWRCRYGDPRPPRDPPEPPGTPRDPPGWGGGAARPEGTRGAVGAHLIPTHRGGDVGHAELWGARWGAGGGGGGVGNQWGRVGNRWEISGAGWRWGPIDPN